MKKIADKAKRNLLTTLWDGTGSVLWLYNIKAYGKREKLVDAMECGENLKKFLHICYKVNYIFFFFFSLVCAYGAGKALVKAFEPEPIKEDSEKSESSEENDFREVTK